MFLQQKQFLCGNLENNNILFSHEQDFVFGFFYAEDHRFLKYFIHDVKQCIPFP